MIAICLSAALLAVQQTDSLREKLEARIAQRPGAEVAVAYIAPASGDTLFLKADSSFHAASTMKVPVMVELFRSSQAGRLPMGQGIMLVNQFASIVEIGRAHV